MKIEVKFNFLYYKKVFLVCGFIGIVYRESLLAVVIYPVAPAVAGRPIEERDRLLLPKGYVARSHAPVANAHEPLAGVHSANEVLLAALLFRAEDAEHVQELDLGQSLRIVAGAECDLGYRIAEGPILREPRQSLVCEVRHKVRTEEYHEPLGKVRLDEDAIDLHRSEYSVHAVILLRITVAVVVSHQPQGVTGAALLHLVVSVLHGLAMELLLLVRHGRATELHVVEGLIEEDCIPREELDVHVVDGAFTELSEHVLGLHLPDLTSNLSLQKVGVGLQESPLTSPLLLLNALGKLAVPRPARLRKESRIHESAEERTVLCRDRVGESVGHCDLYVVVEEGSVLSLQKYLG